MLRAPQSFDATPSGWQRDGDAAAPEVPAGLPEPTSLQVGKRNTVTGVPTWQRWLDLSQAPASEPGGSQFELMEPRDHLSDVAWCESPLPPVLGSRPDTMTGSRRLVPPQHSVRTTWPGLVPQGDSYQGFWNMDGTGGAANDEHGQGGGLSPGQWEYGLQLPLRGEEGASRCVLLRFT